MHAIQHLSFYLRQALLDASTTKPPQPIKINRPTQGFGRRRAWAMGDRVLILAQQMAELGALHLVGPIIFVEMR